MHSTVRVLAAIPLAAALLSCGGGGEPTAPPPPPVDLNAVNAITVMAPSLTVAVGKTLLLSAQATNVNGTVLTGQQFVWSTSSNAMATVEQNGMVLGVGPGSVIVAAAIGAKNGLVTLTVTPAPAAATIAINSGNEQTATVNTQVATLPSVIVKDAAGDPVSGVTVTFAVGPDGGSATGLTQVTNVAGIATVGSWTMGPTAGAQALTATSGTLTGSPVTFTATAAALPSNMRQYNASLNACSNPVLRTGRVEAETAHLTIVADVNNPAGGFTASDYQTMATTFESLVWPVLTENFGVPADIDNTGRVVAFFTRAVNELTLAGSQSFVGGFFYARDLFPKVANNNFQACPGSNEAEMFYIIAPDPSGEVNGNVRATNFIRTIAVGVIGHEMQHLINSSRRLYINTLAEWPEVVYMEEGLAHIAEEMLFYEASGIAPKSNVTAAMILSTPAITAAANSYITSNLGRFSLYLKAPSEGSPYNNNDDLTTRGATWSWLRYLADRGAATPVSGPACGTSIPLAINGTCRLDGAAAAQFTLEGSGSGGSEFTIVAFADGAGFTTAASATNALVVSGPPTPSRFPGASLAQVGEAVIGSSAGRIPLDLAFHGRLRAIEKRELSARVPQARARFAKRSRGLARFSITRAPERASFAAAAVEPVWGRLVNSNDTGLVNLRAEFGQDIGGATRDWAVANYADSAVAGVPSQYTHPSWNFRSVLPILSSNAGAFPLQTQSLAGSSTVTMTNGGATYYRLGVAAATTSTVTFSVNGAAPPANLKLVVIRTK